MFHNIVIGVDGEQGGRDAIALARQLAAPDARLMLVHVYGAHDSSEATLVRGAIGVGYDGSPESDQALDLAQAFAVRDHARIRSLSVVALQSMPDGEPSSADWERIAHDLVDAARQRLSDAGDPEVNFTYGDPGEELEEFSRGLDLLIVGSRSNGPVGRLFNGSTSTHLARRAGCPLLVLPRSASVAVPRPVAASAA